MSTSKQDIERALMKGADSLRDTIDAANYKDYVLPLMFVKYLSDTYAEKVEELEKEYEGVRLERQKRYLPFTVAKDCSFTSLYEQRYADNIGQLINMAMRQIENDNNQQLAGVLNTTDYNSENALGTREHKNAILRDLLEDLYPLNLRPSQIQVQEGQVPADVIGDAYEYMIGQFASMAGKKAGSFYTPAAVSEIMAQIVDVKPGERVYDPTCGSGSLLIKAAKKENSKQVSIFGQEVNGSSVAMAKMNMYIHEISDAKIAWGDTLANPMFKDDDGNLLTFDAIVANMPFSKDKWAAGFNPGGEAVGKGKKEFKMEATLDKHHRFDWGVPPASKGDWAFLLHMIASASVNGRIAAVAPHGVLFRGAAEGRIRTNRDVLFIDASGKDEDGNPRYKKDTNQNVLEQKHIDAIIRAYMERKDIEKFAHAATIDEIKENDYNLNIPRYVDTFEEEALIDIEEVQSNIVRLKAEIAEAEAKMDAYLKELGL